VNCANTTHYVLKSLRTETHPNKKPSPFTEPSGLRTTRNCSISALALLCRGKTAPTLKSLPSKVPPNAFKDPSSFFSDTFHGHVEEEAMKPTAYPLGHWAMAQ